MKDVKIGGLTVSNARPLLVIAGPCQLESLDHAQMIAGHMAEVCAAAGAQYVFKASYDKANRTALSGKRGLGIEAGLQVLQAVRAMGMPVLTDIHDIEQARVSVPSDRSLDRGWRNGGCDQHQEGPVSGPGRHGKCGRQGGGNRE